MADVSDVVVIGAGAAGCAAAFYLAEAGIRTTVVERQGVAAYASGYSAGGLNPLQGAQIPGPLAPMARASFEMHLELWERLEEASGVDFRAARVGSVDVAFDESEFARLEETRALFEAAEGFSAQWTDGSELLRDEPRLSGDALGGLRLFGNAVLDSGLFTQALLRAAESLGATVRHAGVTALETSGGAVQGVVLDDGRIACAAVVVATGPWSGDAEGWLGVSIPVEPLKGEILRLRPPGGPLAHDWSGAGVSLNDRAGGQAWVGATEQSRGWDVNPSEWARPPTPGRRGRAADALVRGRRAGAPHRLPASRHAGLAADTGRGARLGQGLPGDRRGQEGRTARARHGPRRRGPCRGERAVARPDAVRAGAVRVVPHPSPVGLHFCPRL